MKGYVLVFPIAIRGHFVGLTATVGEGSTAYCVAVINFKQDELVPGYLVAIKNQVILPEAVIVIDNSGFLDEDTFAGGKISLVKPEKNQGYADGCNLALSLCRTEYILILNSDVLLEPDYGARLLAFMEEHPETAAASGLLFRYDFVAGEPTRVIESAGIVGSRSGRFWDRGRGAHGLDNFKPAQILVFQGPQPFIG